MNELKPGWVDSIAAAVLSKNEEARSEALGVQPRKRFRIDPAKLAASAARGGRKGGKTRKENYARRRGA